MFVRYFVTVDREFDEVAREFLKGAASWVPAVAVSADSAGGRLLSELGFEVASRRISRRIDVKLGEPLRREGVMLVPIEWRASRVASLFPALTGDVEIAGIGANLTQVGLSGTYEPPFGPAGRLADRALLHRVAELTVKDFVDQVGRRLKGLEKPVA
jgi:hypothetical protein